MQKSKFDPKKHHRRSIRLPEYDYSQPGAYFVTIVAWRRESLFGEVVQGEMKLNHAGKIVRWEWLNVPKRFPYLALGAFIVMPNHLHGILIFHANVGATRQDLNGVHSDNPVLSVKTTGSITRIGSPLPQGSKSASLGAIIAQFKSRVTKRLLPLLKDRLIWQRNYYEHIVRNDNDLKNKTEYIDANPLLWDQGDENPLKGHPTSPTHLL
ncbi:MAG TPA: hypothetical protein VJ785_10495 [Anaerolineales bacterium]|nr:hypothetical protein [Anaerolineales bacterium]